MRQLLPYWFKPSHQVDESAPVEFELKPLDQQWFYTLQVSFGENGLPSWNGVKCAFENGVVNWRNVIIDDLPLEFSRKSVQQILKQPGSGHWMIWLGQIAGELWRNGFLTDEEKKT